MAEGHVAAIVSSPVAVVWNGEVFVGGLPGRWLTAPGGLRPWAEVAQRGSSSATWAPCETSGRLTGLGTLPLRRHLRDRRRPRAAPLAAPVSRVAAATFAGESASGSVMTQASTDATFWSHR